MARGVLLPLLVTMLLAARGEALLGEGPQRGEPSPPARGRSNVRPGLWDALDEYTRGEFDAAVAHAVRTGFDPLQADAWIAAGSRPAQEARRVAAAVCALDVAAARPFLVPRLVTWARDVMNRGEPSPDEALWLRASIAIAEGYGHWTFLLEHGPPPPPPPPPARGKIAPPPAPIPIAHLRYARQRLGDDPHVGMAEVVGAEFGTSPAIVGSGSKLGRRPPGVDRFGGDAADRALLERVGAMAVLRTAAGTAERLTAIDEIGAEAHVRLGHVRLRLGELDAALVSLDAVEGRTTDKKLVYLARLYTGLTLDRLNRVDQAAAAYRSALQVAPGARSATVLLTSLLVRAGRIAESETIATAFMEAPRFVEDPWRSYLLGDYASARGLLSRLRQLVR